MTGSGEEFGARSDGGPTVAPPQPDSLNSALLRNIEALRERRRRDEAEARAEERVAQAITRFTGSMRFVYLHLAAYGFWIVANLGWTGLTPWDPTFVVLAMIASVEAIFLSTFVLISQNRMMAAADRRDDLDLQINLLTEHEVTKIVRMVRAIGDRLGVSEAADAEVHELERDVAPEAVLDAIDEKGSSTVS
ncbi:DUF1003 domain-containing protein [Sphingosinicella terrae]|uniref:DUF1003 domain-containing protein n=1 Tax=Sphingosinicella terrae TaxID=2172047 RepID=UPI000E0D5E14|nr:DUF1003 domain-containing protein [Sphingosinicella terrae]